MKATDEISEPTMHPAIDHIVHRCGTLRRGETVVIVCDARTLSIGQRFADCAGRVTDQVTLCPVPVAAMHGEEPPADVAARMKEADLVFGLTSLSMAHTNARRALSAAGGRYLSLPDYSEELLADPAILVDYHAVEPDVRLVADAFTRGTTLRVTSKAGTDISMQIAGRTGNCCPGYVAIPGTLGSPPDIEANISPLETASEGVVVVDGSIPCPEIGLLQNPVTLVVQGGLITRLDSEDSDVVAELTRLFSAVQSDKAYILAECGVGLNPKARLSGRMLTDEGAAGCVHFGFGSNATVGGVNAVPFHLDFVFRDASVAVDGIDILVEGRLVR